MILSRRHFSRAGFALSGLALLGALTLSACQNTAPAPEMSPQEFLGELYSHYDGKGPGAGLDYSTHAVLERYFTPATMALIEADFARAAAADEIPVLNGDPFVGSQEWDVTGLDIAIGKSAEPEKTMAMVRFDSYGQRSEFRLDLEKVNGAWKIADIDWGYDKLSAILVP